MFFARQIGAVLKSLHRDPAKAPAAFMGACLILDAQQNIQKQTFL